MIKYLMPADFIDTFSFSVNVVISGCKEVGEKSFVEIIQLVYQM